MRKRVTVSDCQNWFFFLLHFAAFLALPLFFFFFFNRLRSFFWPFIQHFQWCNLVWFTFADADSDYLAGGEHRPAKIHGSNTARTRRNDFYSFFHFVYDQVYRRNLKIEAEKRVNSRSLQYSVNGQISNARLGIQTTCNVCHFVSLVWIHEQVSITAIRIVVRVLGIFRIKFN